MIKRVDAVVDGHMVKVVPAADYDEAIALLFFAQGALQENDYGDEVRRKIAALQADGGGEHGT